MKKITSVVAAMLMASLSIDLHAQSAAVTETVETIPSRAGYTQTFIHSRVEKPIATLIMYPGNTGYVGIYPNGSAKFDMFVVMRARRQFAEQGFNVVVADAPSEWGARGLWEKQRLPEYAAHNAALIAWLRQKDAAPVYLVGYSSGAIAAAGVATQLGSQGADGLILLSPWMAPKDKWPIPNFVFDSSFAISSWNDLNRIRGPILLVRHVEDSCRFSRAEYLPGFVAALSVASKPDVVSLSGGSSPSGDPCYPGGRSNFNGLDAELATAVGEWVKRVASSVAQVPAEGLTGQR